MPVDEADTRYLNRALDLAEGGRGCTSPNPLVGAVILRAGEVLGEGYHAGPWRDHAEVAAIKDALCRSGVRVEGDGDAWDRDLARQLLAGTTIYVTLEPCCTYGRTPPCTEALIGSGFARVVVGVVDPTPEVNGRGLELLCAAGIQVDLADAGLAHRAKRQNDGARKAVSTGLPFVTYKYAMTLDGRTATDSGDSRWISSPESRALVHQWRAWADAVVVGAGTLERDDPRLTAREVECARQPLRVVVDGSLRLYKASALVETTGDGAVVVVCGDDTAKARRDEVESWGIETFAVSYGDDGRLDPFEVCRYLVSRDVQTVLLEGGGRLAGAWWGAGLIDKVAAFVCPVIAPGVGNRGAVNGPGPVGMSEALRLRETEVRQSGPDVLISGYTGEPF